MELKGKKELKDWYREKKLPSVVFLFGEDTFQIEKNRNTMITIGAPSFTDFNLYRVDGKTSIDMGKLQDAITSLPFMAESKIVVIDDLVYTSQDSGIDSLMVLIKQKIEGCTILITMTSNQVEMKKKGSKSYKLWDCCNKNGIVCELEKPTRNEICRMVSTLAVKLGARMDTEAAVLLAEYCGYETLRAVNETRKLANYTTEIKVEDVKLLVEPIIEAKIFDLAQSLVDKKLQKALEIVDDLVFQRESPVTILVVLSMSFTDIYRAKTAIKASVPQAQGATELGYFGGSTYRFKKACQIASRIEERNLGRIVEILAKTDKKMKETGANQVSLLELSVVSIYQIICTL